MLPAAQPDANEALRANPAALSIFEALSPQQHSEYLGWIDAAARTDVRSPGGGHERQANANRENS
jgi:hypothetical protein